MIKAWILAAIFAPQMLAQVTTCAHTDTSFRCVKYIKNYDADTITVSIPNLHPLLGRDISVRVSGIDTPEMRTDNKCEKDAATKSRDFVSSLLKSAKRIDLVNIDRDKYFRILAEVEVDGASLSKALLERGFAYAYQGGTKKSVDWCTNKTPHSVGH